MINIGINFRQYEDKQNINTIVVALVVILIGFIYAACVFSLTPGGWSPDSLWALRQVDNYDHMSSVKPVWYVLVWRLFTRIGFNNISAMYHFQNLFYFICAAVFSFSVYSRSKRSVLLLLFLLYFPPFLGINLSNWNNSLCLSLYCLSVALLIFWVRTNSFLPALASLFTVTIAAFFRWEACLLLWPVLMTIILTRFSGKSFLFSKIAVGAIITTIILISVLNLNYNLNDRISNGGRESLFVHHYAKTLVYMSARLNEDLILPEYKSKTLYALGNKEIMGIYSNYFHKYKVYKLGGIVNNPYIRENLPAFRESCDQIFKSHLYIYSTTRLYEIFWRIMHRPNATYTLSTRLLFNYLKGNNAAETDEIRPVRSDLISKTMAKYLAMSDSFYVLYIWPYSFISIVLVFYFIRSLFAGENVIVNRVRPIVGLTFNSHFWLLLVSIGILSGNIEFRYLAPGIFSIVVSILWPDRALVVNGNQEND